MQASNSILSVGGNHAVPSTRPSPREYRTGAVPAQPRQQEVTRERWKKFLTASEGNGGKSAYVWNQNSRPIENSSAPSTPGSSAAENAVLRNRRLRPGSHGADGFPSPESPTFINSSDDEAIIRASHAAWRQSEIAEQAYQEELEEMIWAEQKNKREKWQKEDGQFCAALLS